MQNFEGFLKHGVLLDTTSSENFSKIGKSLGEYSPKKPQKGAILWMLNQYKKIKLYNHKSWTDQICHKTISQQDLLIRKILGHNS